MDPVAAYFLFWVGIFLPAMAVRSSRRINTGVKMPPFVKLQLGFLGVMLFSFALALVAARRVGMPVFGAASLRPVHWLAGVALLAFSLVAATLRFRAASPERRARILAILPKQPSHFWLWTLMVIAAGVCEEATYRGVMFGMVEYLTGGRWWPAALLCALAFAVAHAIQGWRSAAVIGLFALAFQGLVWFTGTLYVAMAVHAIYDFAVGIIYPRIASQQPQPQATSA